jgi:hypothetical protein
MYDVHNTKGDIIKIAFENKGLFIVTLAESFHIVLYSPHTSILRYIYFGLTGMYNTK